MSIIAGTVNTLGCYEYEGFRAPPVMVVKYIVIEPNVSVTYYGESTMTYQSDNWISWFNFLNPRVGKTIQWQQMMVQPAVYPPVDFFWNSSLLWPYTAVSFQNMTLLAYGNDEVRGWWVKFAEWDSKLFYNSGITGAPGFVGMVGVPLYPYDNITNIDFAVSVRRLLSAYIGPCLRVQRSSDNTQQDIGFTATGWLDTGALATFCGSGDGVVTTWYDQSSKGNNATQSNQVAMPYVMQAGVAVKTQGTPSLYFLPTNGFMVLTASSPIPVGAAPVTLAITYKYAATPGGTSPIWVGGIGSSGSEGLVIGTEDMFDPCAGTGSITLNGSTAVGSSLNASSVSNNAGNVLLYQNGIQVGSGSEVLNIQGTTISVGTFPGSSSPMYGYISEFVVIEAVVNSVTTSTAQGFGVGIAAQGDTNTSNPGSGGQQGGYGKNSYIWEQDTFPWEYGGYGEV